MPVKKHQQSGAQKKKKKKTSENEARASLHIPVKLFWLLTHFNVGNNFTSTNASNILSEFPCSHTKISHGFNKNKTKNHCSCSHGNRKLTMVLLLQIIIYQKLLR